MGQVSGSIRGLFPVTIKNKTFGLRTDHDNWREFKIRKSRLRHCHRTEPKVGFTHADFVSRLQIFKISSKNQAKIGPKSVTSSQIFQNRRSHCIEVVFCLRLLGAFQKSADKVGVCKSGLRELIFAVTNFCGSQF